MLSAAGLGAQEPQRAPADSIPIPSVEQPDTTELPPDLADPAAMDLVEVQDSSLWLFEPLGLWGFTIEHYNRVDGLAPAWGFTLEPVDPARSPTITARAAFATTHDRFYWSVGLRQRLPFPGELALRLEHFHRSTSFDTWKVWTRENDVASFVTASDLLDWWREKGIEVALDAESPGGLVGGTLAYVNASQHSQRNRAPFSLFGDEDWRDNPEVEEGWLHSLRLEGRLDTRDVQSPLLPAPGWSIRGTWEFAGGELGGDLGFSRASLDVRRYTQLGRDTWWDSRIVWMGPLGERELPVQREVKLGGPGSLRGFRAASFIGDAGVQAQTEVRLPLPVTDEIAILFLSWHVVGFLDAGTVAVDDNWDKLHADAGLGISGINIFSYVGFFVAHRITDLGGPEDGPRFVVRLRRDF
jgi:hypothetical protein